MFCLYSLLITLQHLVDPLNYGFYMPPLNGKAGKFLDEERPLRDYPAESYGDHLEVLIECSDKCSFKSCLDC